MAPPPPPPSTAGSGPLVAAPTAAVAAMTPRGDEARLFAELHEPLVDSLTSALRGDRHLAEEAATVTWLILLRRQPDRSRPLDGWLYVTALSAARRMRRQGHHLDLFEIPDHTAAGVGRDPLDIVRQRDQLHLLAQLPAAQRNTLTLLARGYSHREIAAATGHTPTWVHRHITEGRSALRRLADED